jgi:dihydroorotase
MTPVGSKANREQPRDTLFYNARVVDPAQSIDMHGGVLVQNGLVAAIEENLTDAPEGTDLVDCGGKLVCPGLIDMRVFTGEPGAEHRETLASASRAAAAGGVTTMICMPDTDPVIDDIALVDYFLRRARDTAIVRLAPMAAITRGLLGKEMTEIGLLSAAGAVGFTDGRNTITNAQVMRNAMTYARDFDAVIAHHTEDPDLKGNGVMNEGETSARLGLPGIPVEAETVIVERDLHLADLTASRYHAAQISTGKSLDAITRAKNRGVSVTCGISVNHLCLNEHDVGGYRTFLKMSPPLRAEADRAAMVQGVADGLIDIIVSSHDPQDVETKRHPFAEAADGAVGLETLLAAALRLVHSGDCDLKDVLACMTSNPAALLGLDTGTLKPGSPADLILVDADAPWAVEERNLRSRSKNTPFEGDRFLGRVLRTMVAGRTIYE